MREESRGSSRWAPSTRALLTVLTGLASVQLVLALATLSFTTSNGDGRFRLPLPDRVAAIAALAESVPTNDTDLLARALDTQDFQVAFSSKLSEDEDRADYPVAAVAAAVERYVEVMGDRAVLAWIAPDEATREHAVTFQATRLWSSAPLRLAVELRGRRSGWLLIETRDRLPERVFGFPPGLWAGALGVLVAFVSLAVVWRGLAPLGPLSRRLDAFAARPEAVDLPERGVREVRGVTRAVNTMQHRMSDLLEERRAMFAALTHDLRTYLARMSLRIEGIADLTSRDRARADLNEMNEMIDGALAFAGIGEAVTLAPVDLAELAREVAGDARIPIAFGDAASEAYIVASDRVLLKRALSNLVGNAKRHATDAEMTVARENDRVVVEVLDRGTGIALEDVDRLLRPFERGDRARTLDTPGSGLGLAIANRVAELHGGGLRIEKRTGGGARVRFEVTLAFSSG